MHFLSLYYNLGFLQPRSEYEERFLFVFDSWVATRKARFFSSAGKEMRKGKCGMQKE